MTGRFKRPVVDSTQNFPESCGQFVCQTKESGLPSYADADSYPVLLSTPKRVKVDVTREFPENCGPQTNEIAAHCSVDSEMKSCSQVSMNADEVPRRLRNSNGKPVLPGVSGQVQKVKEVREVRKRFDDLHKRLLQEDEAQHRAGPSKRHIHVKAAMCLKNQGKWINCGWTFGHVPGVEIGDQFRFRVELAMIGIHQHFVRGIHYVNVNGKDVATSIVHSGRYDNEVRSSQTLIYAGEGGNHKAFSGKVEDQKLEGGNLALKNSKDMGYPVRVIMKSGKSDIRYIYDGLYTVVEFYQEKAPTGKSIFKFEFTRNLDQPKLTREFVSQPANINCFRQNDTKTRKSVRQRENVVHEDISQGKEKIPIYAINGIDDERPRPFTYITKMKYPNLSKRRGCKCTSGCSDNEQCSCASRNGGEIPFNTKGGLVRAKSLIYECGPFCGCSPSCNNRVSQHGPRFRLEVFKTESRGWGLRSRDRIPIGGFICEYVGELLDEEEAEKRIDDDEYLFDIGNYDDEEAKILKRSHVRNSLRRKDEDGFTLDAAKYGNVGRFINHSCSPNVFPQNVMYDHGDKRAPHIMFFASESIPPLQELTYDYNYQVGDVSDANGNLKKKICSCGSRKCSGRMY